MDLTACYTVGQNGSEYGLKDWYTVFRNGNPVRHFKFESDTEIWIRDRKAAEVASGERTASPVQVSLGYSRGH